MNESQARAVLLVAACEGAGESPHWKPDDRAWATRQALAGCGEDAAPERFVTTRASLALSRLAPRVPSLGRWVERRPQTAAWALLAALLGLLLGLAADQLGAPDRVNLLAPAVWVVVAWNLAVFATAVLPGPRLALPGVAERLLRRASSAGAAPLEGLASAWLTHAAPLLRQRALGLLHVAAAALAAGLAAGMYLRGLVLDYRAGWQSTFLDAATVQFALDVLLGPAAWITGITVPAVAPLQLGPGMAADASAAPWIHLYATTLALVVVLPRLLLAAVAAARAARLSAHFPLPLTGPYFEGLHPLMRRGPRRPLTLLWCPADPAAPPAPARLLGHAVPEGLGLEADPGAREGLHLLDCPEGESMRLLGVPAALHRPPPPRPWWQFWAPASEAEQALARLRAEVDAVLLVVPPGRTHRPPWLAELSRPVLLLEDADTATAPALPLRALADGWLADGALWQALAQALPEDPRVVWLAAAWRERQRERLVATAEALAACLLRVAQASAPLPPERGRALATLGGRATTPGDGDGAQPAPAAEPAATLVRGLEDEFTVLARRLAELDGLAPDDPAAVPALAGALALIQPKAPARVREGRAALWGGLVSGALAGLKADVATGGLTMGAGALTGGVLGALGAAGVAKGVNVARGADANVLRWAPAELDAIAQAALKLALALRGTAVAEARLSQALAGEAEALAAAWRERGAVAAPRLAAALARVLERAPGGPAQDEGPASYTRAA